jgi:hypothetical protein
MEFDYTGLTSGPTGLTGQTRPANFGCKQTENREEGY